MPPRVAVVTGATAGIGRAIAESLARAGCRLVLVARRSKHLAAVAEEALALGADAAHAVTADLRAPAAVDVISTEAGRVGPVSILINNAGGSAPVPAGVAEADATWRETLEVQFHAPRALAERMVPGMVERAWGRVVNIGAPLEPPWVLNASTAAKGALTIWSKMLSSTLGRHGVTVNTVAPGRILTEQVVERLHPTAADRHAFAADHIPLGYMGEPNDVAEVVAFLVSDKARYVTGELIHVDGGLRRAAT